MHVLTAVCLSGVQHTEYFTNSILVCLVCVACGVIQASGSGIFLWNLYCQLHKEYLVPWRALKLLVLALTGILAEKDSLFP